MNTVLVAFAVWKQIITEKNNKKQTVPGQENLEIDVSGVIWCFRDNF